MFRGELWIYSRTMSPSQTIPAASATLNEPARHSPPWSFHTAHLLIQATTSTDHRQGLWSYRAADGHTHTVHAPILHVDNQPRICQWNGQPQVAPPVSLPNGTTELRWSAAIVETSDILLTLIMRVADDSPVVRFHYHITAQGSHHLSKPEGKDFLHLAALTLPATADIYEVRLSEFDDMIHSYIPNEERLDATAIQAGLSCMGPILVADDHQHQVLLAYEHGSTHPDRFIEFTIDAQHHTTMQTVKGSYWQGQPLNPDHDFTTPWCHIAALPGTRDDAARAFRHFILHRQALSQASRQPWIFYNTWNYQERRKHWFKDDYLSEMHLTRMLAEIDAAASMGIEVFVIDTGWYQKPGDWQTSDQRFPDQLQHIIARLKQHGMRLGLWFAPGTVALTSQALANHQDCVRHAGDGEPKPHVVWETELSIDCCLSTQFADAFARQLIRLHRELGVSYFKWDAIGQYGCDRPDHGHGDASISAQERADCHAFQQPSVLANIAEQVASAVPDAICDFDVTEPGRSVGLAFLAASKYFLINNGPYFKNFDNPNGADGNSNLFFFPGQARPRVCRSSLSYDRWIPSVLFLTHYLPDDGPDNQHTAIASLILGHNGIWGDLCAISDDGRAIFQRGLSRYKLVRQAITAATPVRRGRIGGAPEIHEKIDPQGRGAIVLFTNHAGTFHHVSTQPIDANHLWTSPGSTVDIMTNGHAVITATFAKPGAVYAFFGIDAATD